jgi:hypothetical protein
MRLIAATALAAVLLAGAVTTPQTGVAAGRAACSSDGKAIAANSRLRVYRVGPRANFRIYACMLPRGNRRFLARGTDNDDGGPGRFQVAGRFVAYADGFCSRSSCATRVLVVDVRRDRAQLDAQPPDTRGITDLAVTPGGRAAWVRRIIPFNGSGERYEVVVRAEGGPQTVDAGSDIAPDSLAISGATVYWTRGGIARSATLT